MPTSDDDETGTEEEEVDPKVLARIEKISEILNQTNINLNMFERLLPTYRAEEPAPRDSHLCNGSEVTELRLENQNLTRQLSDLQTKFSCLQESLLRSEAKCDELTVENTKLTLTNDQLSNRISELQLKIDETRTLYSSNPTQRLKANLSEGKENRELDLGSKHERRGVEKEGFKESDTVEDLKSLQKKLGVMKVSRDKLKSKTRELLRHYRTKRSLLDKRERQLISQKAGLIKLQSLHENLQSSHLVVVDHLGQELGTISRLVALLLSEGTEPPRVGSCSRSNLSTWYTQIENLVYWTKSKLISQILKTAESSSSHQTVLYQKLERFTREKYGQDETLVETGKQLSSISESLSLCSNSQETTLKYMIKELEM